MSYPNPFDLRHQRPGSGGDLVKRFLSTYGSRKTRRNYRTDLRQFFGEEEVTRQVASQVRKKDVIRFFRERTDSLKRTTIERKVESNRSFFRWLADRNVIEEPPIREDLDTGDLVDRIFEEALETTKEEKADGKSNGERASRDENGSGGRGKNDATRSIREPIPMELEPGSEVDLDDETASGDGESSPPRGGPSQDAGDEEPSGSGQNESPSSKTLASEDRLGGESSETGSKNSYSTPSTDGPSEENPDQESTPDEETGEDRSSKETPIREESTGEEQDRDSPTVPQWAVPSGNATEIDLRGGERVSLAELPDALCWALQAVENTGGVAGLFLRCTEDLAVRIRLTQDQGSVLAHARIKHRLLTRLAERGGDLSKKSALRQAIVYLEGRGWALPKGFYDYIGALPGPAEVERPFSDEHPKWSQEDIDDQMIRMFMAAEITGAFAGGFGIGKDEKVFLSD